MRKVLAALICLSLSVAAAAAQAGEGESLRTWLETAPAIAAYHEKAAALFQALKPAVAASVPPEVLRARVTEAAAKGIAPERALEILGRDAQDLALIAGLIHSEDWPLSADRPAFYALAAAALRNGVGQPALQAIFSGASDATRDPHKAGAALAAAAALRRTLPSSDKEIADFTAALASSKIPPDKMSSFPSLAAMARSGGMGSSDFYAISAQALRAGASFTAIERSIKRKVKR